MPGMNGTGPFGQGRSCKRLGPCRRKGRMLEQVQSVEQPSQTNEKQGGWRRGWHGAGRKGIRLRGICARF